MRVAHATDDLGSQPRAVAIGTFDGVHAGHRSVLRAAVESGLVPTVLTFHPHPRTVVGSGVELLATLERRLELLSEAGIVDTLVVPFTLSLSRLSPEEFAERYLTSIGTQVVLAGPKFRFGRDRSGDLDVLRRLGFGVPALPVVEGVSSSAIRHFLHEGDVAGAARLLGRAAEVEGTVVEGDARGTGLGFPTANLAPPPGLLVPANGIYAGAADAGRAAVSIGLNPHYGGQERRIEAFLLDFGGDLYGKRLVVELWRRLRDERTFGSEDELVAQIARDVEETRATVHPLRSRT